MRYAPGLRYGDEPGARRNPDCACLCNGLAMRGGVFPARSPLVTKRSVRRQSCSTSLAYAKSRVILGSQLVKDRGDLQGLFRQRRRWDHPERAS